MKDVEKKSVYTVEAWCCQVKLSFPFKEYKAPDCVCIDN